MKTIGKYSFGIGDRFGLQGEAQLEAFCRAKAAGIDITPVWNKSKREPNLGPERSESGRTHVRQGTSRPKEVANGVARSGPTKSARPLSRENALGQFPKLDMAP